MREKHPVTGADLGASDLPRKVFLGGSHPPRLCGLPLGKLRELFVALEGALPASEASLATVRLVDKILCVCVCTRVRSCTCLSVY